MAVAEALSANLPVVVSDEVALAGEIEEAGAGAVFRYADVPDLTAALARVAAAVADSDCATAAVGAAVQPSGLPAAIFRVRTHSTPVGIFGR